MFQLYKKRTFSQLINDTFSFIKAEGKNYFSKYLAVNGGILLVLMVLLFVAGRIFFEGMFNGLRSPEAQAMLSEYFDANATLFIVGGILTVLLVVLLMLLNLSFPVVYLNLLEDTPKPTTKMIFKQLKAKALKIIVFVLASLITFVPIGIIVGLLSVLLFITIIGIPVAYILFASLSCWIFLTFYNYLLGSDGYFTAMKQGFDMLFKNYWAHMGTVAIFWLILFALQMVITLVISITSLLGTYVAPDETFTGSTSAVVMFVINMAINYFFTTIIMLSQGMIYYSCKEATEHITLHNDIDLIGQDSE